MIPTNTSMTLKNSGKWLLQAKIMEAASMVERQASMECTHPVKAVKDKAVKQPGR